MHISEGVLTAPVLGAGAVLTVTGHTIGLQKMDYETLPDAPHNVLELTRELRTAT
jgi:ABC-type Co2+ transport system permease subunit